ncbi:MAG: hypothetical protein PHC66_01660 [Candidatus Nanoarchaeia archaeon]|nr:hypothetical protein [Candidatus Nanoarchaeia archaeon]MDD5238918.1 hypothetical protein [Candidatus Nanoarchaeia archaeon]
MPPVKFFANLAGKATKFGSNVTSKASAGMQKYQQAKQAASPYLEKAEAAKNWVGGKASAVKGGVVAGAAAGGRYYGAVKDAGHRMFGGLSIFKGVGPVIGIFLIILLIMVVFWFMSKGGLQATGGSEYTAEKQTETLFQNVWIRRVEDWFANPFGVRATSGEYEETSTTSPTTSTAPNQAFTVEIKTTPSIVQYNTNGITAVITTKNEGTTIIKELKLNITSEQPAGKCLRFDTLPAGCSPVVAGEYICNISDVYPLSSKQLVISGGYIDETCVGDTFGTSFDPAIPVSVFVNVKGSTYYPASSRLAVERIKTAYGTLLIQNSLLMQQQRGAIYQTGTALTLDMDAGEQPILDSVDQGGLLFSWTNVGNGKMDSTKNPFLFIVTPDSFGQCIFQGLGSTQYEYTLGQSVDVVCDNTAVLGSKYKCIVCDASLQTSWCQEGNPVYQQIEKSAGSIKESFDWACGLVGNGYHVCATNGLTQEFGLMTCPLVFTEPINANRITRYVTAVALYPYVVEAPYSTVQAFRQV